MASILIVDDRPTNRQFLLTLLGYGGHRLFEAANGAEALERVRAEHPDLVITDILMPTMDGYEFVRHLRADPDLAPMPVIFYTATYSEPQAKALADTCGVRIVLPKPCEPERILAAVDEALGTSGPTLSPPATATQPADQAGGLHKVDDQLAEYVNELHSVKSKFDEIVESSVKLRGKRDQVRQLSEQFSDNVMSLQRIASRLSAIIEVGMEMTAERNPGRLVELFFAAACDIIDSKYAAIAMLDEQEQALKLIFSKGVEAQVYQEPAGGAGLLGALLSGHRPLRSRSAEATADGLPRGHPPVRNFLGVPVASKERVYGWLFFADKRGEGEFSEEDERLAGMMAAKLAVLYENAVLYDVIQRHAAQLQVEIAERRQAAAALAESEFRFRQLTENITEVFWLTDPSKNEMLYISPAYEKIWGRSCAALHASPREWLDAIHPEDRQRVLEAAIAKQARGDYDEEYRIVRPDGSIRWIRDQAFPVSDPGGRPYRIAGVAEDVTKRKQAEIRILSLNRVYAVLSGINTLIVRVRDRQELFDEACRIAVEDGNFGMAWIGEFDRTSLEVTPVAWKGMEEGATLRKASARDDIPEGRGMVGRAIRGKKPVISNDVGADPGAGGPRREEALRRGFHSIIAMPLMLDGEVTATLTLFARERNFFSEEELKLLTELAGDISFALDHIEKADRLDYLAYYDSTTGVANRKLFIERVDQRIRIAAVEKRRLALAILDVERFKDINDTFGRHIGDQLLRVLAERFTKFLGDPDRIGRVLGDQFGIVIPDVHSEDEVARRIDRKLKECVGAPVRLGDNELRISARAGIAMYPEDGPNADTLFRNAEAALKRAKAGGERYLFYTQRMTERVGEKLALENQLRLALEREEFVLHYQPKVDTATRRIEGIEALIRWQNRALGLVPPMQFIPLLEETGLILEVGAWALRRAARDYRRWSEQGLAVPRVAVNVSAIQVRRRDFVETTLDAIGKEGGRSAIDLEVTESLIMEDIDANIGKFETLRLAGMEIAIDDFGTGYSSLAYLAKLPVQSLKIDRSFIVAMLMETAIMTLVSTIVSLAHTMKLKVVAEGVETEEQAGVLDRLGCDQLQGYLISKPRPFDEVARLFGSRA